MTLQLPILENLVGSLDAAEGLRTISRLGVKVKFSTSLGEEDQVITHLIAQNNLEIDVFTLDTGRLFYEVYDLLQLTSTKYGINIQTYHPDPQEVSDYSKNHGVNGFYKSISNRQECCAIRKIKPLQQALAGAEIWITGLRAEQSENRAGLKRIDWDDTFEIVKFNPLIDWTLDQVQDYILTNSIPTNPLHKKGFVSIGCAPCTRAIEQGENPRAGRWWWEQSKKECGLHQH